MRKTARGGPFVMPMVFVPIRRDPMTVVNVEVGQHEIPLLEAIHGSACDSGQIQPSFNDYRFDSAAEEYDRLKRLYGPPAGASYVSQAYGDLAQFERLMRVLCH